MRKTTNKGIKHVIKLLNALIRSSFEIIKLVKKGNIIFIFDESFYEEISKNFPSGIHFGWDFLYHSLVFPVRDKEKIFIHTSSY